MKLRINSSWMMLTGAVVFGGLAVFAASRYISQRIQAEQARLNPNVEQMDVVVAKGDLERGTIVGSDNMAVRRMPKEFVPGTAVDPASFGNVEGARLGVPMRRGEVLIRGTLEGADTATFATRVVNGVRAITLTVDEVNSLAGLLQPNDRVDLYLTAKPIKSGHSDPAAIEQTQLLMQNVLILATGRQVRPTISEGGQPGVGRSFTTITIEAAPIDVQRLILAQKSGSLTAALRGGADKQAIVASSMDASALFGGLPRAKIGNRGPAPLTTEIIVGGHGGRPEREILQMLGLERPPTPAATGAAAPPPVASRSVVDNLRDLLKASAPPADAATMTR